MPEQVISDRYLPLRVKRIGTAVPRDPSTNLSVWFETDHGGWGFVPTADDAEKLAGDLLRIAEQRRATAKRQMS